MNILLTLDYLFFPSDPKEALNNLDQCPDAETDWMKINGFNLNKMGDIIGGLGTSCEAWYITGARLGLHFPIRHEVTIFVPGTSVVGVGQRNILAMFTNGILSLIKNYLATYQSHLNHITVIHSLYKLLLK